MVRVHRAARRARTDTRSPITNIRMARAISVRGRRAASSCSLTNSIPDGPRSAPTIRNPTSSGKWRRASSRLAKYASQASTANAPRVSVIAVTLLPSEPPIKNCVKFQDPTTGSKAGSRFSTKLATPSLKSGLFRDCAITLFDSSSDSVRAMSSWLHT